MKKFEAGFIGAGNMGGALATAAAKQVTGELVAVACSSPAHSAAAAERLGCRAAAPEEILGGSKFVFRGVGEHFCVHARRCAAGAARAAARRG